MKLILRVLLGLYIFYLVLVVLVVNPALNILPAWYMKKTYDRDLHSEIILFNPFTLALEVRQAELPEHTGERFIGLHGATVNLSLESLWQQGIVFDEVSVRGLYTHVRQLTQDSFNFSDLVPQEEPAPPVTEKGNAEIPGVTIHDFDFHSERLAFTNETREKPYSTVMDGLHIQVSEISTVLVEGRPYRLDARGEAGGELHWEGTVSIPASRSEGKLKLSNISLVTAWRFAEPWLNMELTDGRLTVEADYSVSWGDVLDYQLSDGALAISSIDIRPINPEDLADTAVGLRELTVSGIGVDGTAQHVDVDTITIDGVAVDGWMDESRVSLVELFAVDLPDSAAPQAETEAPAAEKDAGTETGWTAALSAVKLTNSRAGWRSQFTEPPLLEVAPIEVSAENILWPLAQDTQLDLQLAINSDLTLSTGGALDLGTGVGKLNYALQGLPLVWANPNLPAALNAVITDGLLEVEGDMTMAGFAPGQITANGAITNFSGSLQDTEESLTSLESMRWQDLAIDLDQRSVVLQQLSIKKYSGRIHIKKDGSINAQNVWKEEVGEQAEEIAEDLSLDKPWEISIPTILVAGSQIDFMDESLPIVFRTVIGQLNGEVTGISTDPGAQARVDMEGSVDGYAPVLLAGTAQPLSEPPALDLDLSFNGVDMALLTPYSGTYAGYAIDRGLLNLKLKYALAENRLKGHNSIRIDQMKLGEKVDSDKAADIPLELALALLTDANGVIDLQVPVSGNVDDPEFNIGGVVVKAFLNLITKAVTAPFALLANLVGSEEDLQRVNFTLGSAELDEPAKAKLQQLSTAMAQRPALNLVITGRVNPDADRAKLQQAALRQELLEGGLSESELEATDSAWAKAIEKRYRDLGLAAEGGEVSVRQQYERVAQSIKVSDADLEKLAQERSVAVKTFLVNEAKLGPDRAVIEKTALADKANIFSGAELGAGT